MTGKTAKQLAKESVWLKRQKRELRRSMQGGAERDSKIAKINQRLNQIAGMRPEP